MNTKYYTIDRKNPSVKYSCSPYKTNKLKEMCIKNLKGKYNTLEECAFSNECFEKQRNMPKKYNVPIISYMSNIDDNMPIISYMSNIDYNMPIISYRSKGDNMLINRIYKMNNSQILKYEQKLYNRLGINNNNSLDNQNMSINLLTNRSYKMNNSQISKYEQKLYDRLGINNNNSSKNSSNLEIILSKLLDNDNLLILSELHTHTPLKFIDKLLDILVKLGFNYFLCETDSENPPNNNKTYSNYSYTKHYLTIKKMCENKRINFINIETKETRHYVHIRSEERTSASVNKIWAQFALDILSQNDGSKIIYFIGTDHAGFGSSRFQTVPYLLKHPITINLINSGKNKLSFNKPTHSCYNYLTLNY